MTCAATWMDLGNVILSKVRQRKTNSICYHSKWNLIFKTWHKWTCLPGGPASNESTCNVGDLALIPGLGRPPGEGNGYPLQYPGLENSMDCIGHGVAKSWIRQRLSFHFTNKLIYKIETNLWISKTSLWLPVEKCWWRDTLGAWDKHTWLLCLTLCNSVDYTVHGILQARIREWVGVPFSRGSFQPRDQIQVSPVASWFFTSWTTREAQEYWSNLSLLQWIFLTQESNCGLLHCRRILYQLSYQGNQLKDWCSHLGETG